MKIHIATMVAAILVLSSCTKEFLSPDRVTGDTMPLTLAITDGDLNVVTRNYLSDVALTQEWESRIESINIYMFDASGNRVLRYQATSEEVSNGRATLDVPRRLAGTECAVYVLANFSAPWTNTVAELTESKSQFTLKDYNGDYFEMISGSFFKKGFPMSGMTRHTLPPYGFLTEIHVKLERLHAKVATEIRVDPDFADNHDGAVVRIDRIICGSVGTESYIIERSDGLNAQTLYNNSIYQSPFVMNSWHRNIFYVLERGRSEFSGIDTQMCVTVIGTYDEDGDFTTTADQHQVAYEIPVDYSTGQGVVKRNTCYRISATIGGLGSRNMRVVCENKDWVSLPVHKVNIKKI